MKRFVLIVSCIFLPFILLAQSRFSARVYDGINYAPIASANIYNITREKFSFSDKSGYFSIDASLYDTLVISKSFYKQNLVVVTPQMLASDNYSIFLYCRPVVLKEVSVFGLNPSYEGFKRDVVNIDLPDVYYSLGTKPTKEDIANAEYKNTAPNILKNTPIAHPFTALYEAFSRKARMKRLYNEMVSYDAEIDNVQSKFNPQLVSDLTGLTGNDVMDFMVYCHFSYYDLIRSSREDIINKIRQKFVDYEYFKAINEE